MLVNNRRRVAFHRQPEMSCSVWTMWECWYTSWVMLVVLVVRLWTLCRGRWPSWPCWGWRLSMRSWRWRHYWSPCRTCSMRLRSYRSLSQGETRTGLCFGCSWKNNEMCTRCIKMWWKVIELWYYFITVWKREHTHTHTRTANHKDSEKERKRWREMIRRVKWRRKLGDREGGW